MKALKLMLALTAALAASLAVAVVPAGAAASSALINGTTATLKVMTSGSCTSRTAFMSPAVHAAKTRRTISTFSRDVAYAVFRSEAMPRAARLALWRARRRAGRGSACSRTRSIPRTRSRGERPVVNRQQHRSCALRTTSERVVEQPGRRSLPPEKR